MYSKYLIISCVLLSGCVPNIQPSLDSPRLLDKNIEKQLDKSYARWIKLRNKHGGSYSYERDFHSWRGYANSTKLLVENNRVESRYFFEWQKDSSPSLTWAEPFMELGLHNEGAAIKTIDQLYQQCQTEIITKPQDQYKITVALDHFGLLKQCSYRKNSCFDDCTKGIKINDLVID